ncbi:MAG: SDR family NAD(P)-dependent oxidoreductase [Hyphomicrobiales bacterium]|nr:MAG: SDR family NAD(P)-dependent oxidoreductase [Hyphomicrobiales bacterium]
MTDLTGKIVLVTGASRGIGYQAAIEAGRRGAHVIAVARTVGGLEDLDDAIKQLGSETTLVPLDIRDGDAIDRLGAAIYERWGKLDGLVANAGVLGTITPLSHLDVKDFDQAFAVNVTANYRLIRSLDLLLRQSDAGRAVFVSSSASQSGHPFWGLYSATKAALEAMVRSYAGELSVSKVKANVFWPGAVRTAMRAKAMPGEDPATLPMPAEIAPKLIDMIAPAFTETGMIYDFKTSELRPL